MSESKLPSLRKLTAVFAGGNFLSMIIRLSGGFLTARLSDPAVLGLFNGIGLVIGYVPFLQLGVLNGLNRELPYYIGSGDKEHAHALAATAQAWALIVGSVTTAGLLIYSIWHLASGSMDLAAGWFTNAVGAFLFFAHKCISR
ncbi:MAG: hypothetical protein IPQ16_07675 [Geobacteraceae bacterium]|nr:hypothetical protein [Geobacteraceae bacterium]